MVYVLGGCGTQKLKKKFRAVFHTESTEGQVVGMCIVAVWMGKSAAWRAPDVHPPLLFARPRSRGSLWVDFLLARG